jgi:hypothetical protein
LEEGVWYDDREERFPSMKTKTARRKTETDKIARASSRRAAALKVAKVAVGSVAAGGAAALALKHRRTSQVKKTVQYLEAHLGAPTTAYLSGADDTLAVDRWLEGERPDDLGWRRLQHAYQATRCLVEAYDDMTAQSWFLGMNPSLREESPARVLRNTRDSRIFKDVVLAAREFAET